MDRRIAGIAKTGTVAGGFFTVICGAAGQANSWSWQVEYSNPGGFIREPGDTATVTLWAAWDPAYYAFRGALLDVVADDPTGAGEWVEWETLPEVFSIGYSSDGTLDKDAIRGIKPLQPYWPYFPPIYPHTDNPIAVWRATWTTEEFAHRDVEVTSLTQNFWVWDQEAYFFDFADSLGEGGASISVVPSAATGWVVLAVLPLVNRSRR